MPLIIKRKSDVKNTSENKENEINNKIEDRVEENELTVKTESNSKLAWTNPVKDVQGKTRYNKQFLDLICEKYNITLLDDYTDVKINRDIRIKGECLNCRENFNKVFRQLVNGGPFCIKCMKKLEQMHKINNCIQKHGVKNPFQRAEIKEKSKQTRIKRLGVEYPLQSKFIQEKCKKTNLERRNVEYSMQCEEVKNKSKQTNLKRRGVENPMQSKEVQEKAKQTSLKHFGVEYPMQNIEIASKSRYHFKEYIFPSGRKELVQGYEQYVLDFLIKQGILEDDIVVKRTLVPKVWYKFNLKVRRYYTDIYIKSQNKCIEVKSNYYFKKEKDQNLAKQQAVKDLDIGCEIWILNKKKQIIEILE